MSDLTNIEKQESKRICEECGEELADGEDGLCDNCCYVQDEEDEFEEDDPIA